MRDWIHALWPDRRKGFASRLSFYGSNARSNWRLLTILKCSSLGGEPIVAQKATPITMAAKIVAATSLKFIFRLPRPKSCEFVAARGGRPVQT